MDAKTKVEKLTELLKDETTARKLFGMSIQEAQTELAKQGLDFSIEEMQAIAQGIADSNSDDDDELNEAQLTEVTGGSKNNDWYYQQGRKIGKICKWLFTTLAPYAVGLW